MIIDIEKRSVCLNFFGDYFLISKKKTFNLFTFGFNFQLSKLALMEPAITMKRITAIFKIVKTEFSIDDSLTPIMSMTIKIKNFYSVLTIQGI